MSLISKRYLVICLFFSLAVLFQGVTISVAQADVMQLTINQDKCIKCHKRNGVMEGVHANNTLALTCLDCHVDRGTHPRKTNDLIVGFTDESKASAVIQTQTCMACHDEESLAAADWTHNVHSNKLNCAQCHQLHSELDPIAGISPSDRSDMCANCHTPK